MRRVSLSAHYVASLLAACLLSGTATAQDVPKSDLDQDGVADADDKCPRVVEDRDGFEDADGCPEPDNDKDGIIDVDDNCPMLAEDKDGSEDADGCPDPDNDNDGIPDVYDKCPGEPETYNGRDDEDGCPERSRGVWGATKIEIRDRIHFTAGSGAIPSESYPILNEVAAVLKAHPAITKVRVCGHTDSQGKARKNRELSQRRAEAVRAYLIARGIASERLEAVGYGSEKPVEMPGTPEGAEKNRRVEFLILKGGWVHEH